MPKRLPVGNSERHWDKGTFVLFLRVAATVLTRVLIFS